MLDMQINVNFYPKLSLVMHGMGCIINLLITLRAYVRGEVISSVVVIVVIVSTKSPDLKKRVRYVL